MHLRNALPDAVRIATRRMHPLHTGFNNRNCRKLPLQSLQPTLSRTSHKKLSGAGVFKRQLRAEKCGSNRQKIDKQDSMRDKVSFKGSV